MHLRSSFSLGLTLTLLLASNGLRAASSPPRRAVSLVLLHGKVFTADARGTIAEAVAVEGERIVAVGPSAEIRARFMAESAYASFEEAEKGQVAAGMLADLIVHTKDLLTIEPREILQTEPELTIFAGRVVYERAATSGAPPR